MDSTLHLDMSEVAAIVLGGGRGARLHPLTAQRAKPAVPLLGRYRLVDIPLSNCIHSDVRQIFVLTQYNSASLNQHISTTYRFDTFTSGFVEILAAEQTFDNRDWYQGTADAVRKQLRHFQSNDTKHYMILSGDQLYRMDYRAFMATHLSNNADITIAALPVQKEVAQRFGILQINNAGRIRHFVEKPAHKNELAPLATPKQVLDKAGLHPRGGTFLASMGVYLFRADVLKKILEEHMERIDFGKDIIPNVLDKYRVHVHLFDGFWEDIGTVRSYYEVHMRLTQPDPPFRFYDPGYAIYTHPRYLPGSRIYDATVNNSIICEGSRIYNGKLKQSVIGIRSIIREKARIEKSIILGADYFEHPSHQKESIRIGIGRNTLISNAIIDKNARIGENVVIRGGRNLKDTEGNGFTIRDGIIVVHKNAVVPSGTCIGRGL